MFAVFDMRTVTFAGSTSLEVAQPVEVDVEDRDVRAEARRHLRRVRADDPAAENDDLRGLDAGHAAEQDAHAADRPLEVLRAFLDRHAAGDLAHRDEERERAVLVHRLVGDGDRAGLEHAVREGLAGREVEVGEYDLVLADHLDLDRLGLLDLDDHVGLAEDLLGRGDDRRARRAVVGVGEAASDAGALLDEHLVPVLAQGLGPHREKADPVFSFLDLFRNADNHQTTSCLGVWNIRIRQKNLNISR